VLNQNDDTYNQDDLNEKLVIKTMCIRHIKNGGHYLSFKKLDENLNIIYEQLHLTKKQTYQIFQIKKKSIVNLIKILK
jgi:hypothetical protein